MLAFSKYHGLGNDFVVVDVPRAEQVDAALARQLCDRHFGVGADGILEVSPSQHAAARLVIRNADGSRPEMCGNGLRCVALHLARTGRAEGAFAVETDAGVLHCQLHERDGERWATLSLGHARLDGVVRLAGPQRDERFQRVSVGNPHAVLLDHLCSSSDIDDLGPRLSATIPGGANVEFVRVLGPQRLEVVVWERGVGRTLACGTGAGAAVVAAAAAERAPFDLPVRVLLPGGELEVTVRQRDLEVVLSGPARHVFDGSLSLPGFAEN